MNISIYLPDKLKQKLDRYATDKGISKNAAIRKAVEILLTQEKQKAWGSWIEGFDGDQSVEAFESHRQNLKKPNEAIF